MANELQAYLPTGKTLYAILLNSIGQVWDGSVWETINSGTWTDYDIPLTEAAAGIYLGNMPDVVAGNYSFIVYEQAGVNPATTDTINGYGNIDWDGEEVLGISDINEDVWAYATRTLTQSATSIISAVSGSSITDIRGNSWDIDIADLTLDDNLIQFAIRETKLDTDAKSLILVDTDTGLLYVNGAEARDATKASLSYAGTTLTVTVDASITAALPTGNYRYGIQSVTAAGVVLEVYGGTFTITADTVRATE